MPESLSGNFITLVTFSGIWVALLFVHIPFFFYVSDVFTVLSGMFLGIYGNVLGNFRATQNVREFQIEITGNSKGMFRQSLPGCALASNQVEVLSSSAKRRKLNLKPKFEGGSLFYSFKRLVPGAGSMRFIG